MKAKSIITKSRIIVAVNNFSKYLVNKKPFPTVLNSALIQIRLMDTNNRCLSPSYILNNATNQTIREMVEFYFVDKKFYQLSIPFIYKNTGG